MENELYKALRALTKKEDVEKKKSGNGIALDYISWATAWDAVCEAGHKIKRTVYETPEGRIYWDDGNTAWVKVGISVDGEDEQIEYLPIMGFKNDAITLERITAMEVNKAIQRCTVKAIARAVGYGIQLYIGEDLPEEQDGNRQAQGKAKPQTNKPSKAQMDRVKAIMAEKSLTKEFMSSRFGNDCFSTFEKTQDLIAALEKLP